MKLIIRNGNIVNKPGCFEGVGDILISDGIIADVAKRIEPDASEPFTLIDANGLDVLPGLIDAHCHLRDPGYEYKENIETGTASAALGGFTAVACMPNTDPVTDNEQVVRYIINKAKEEGYVKVHPIGALSKGLKGEELSETGELKFAGAVAITDDGKPVSNPSLMKKALMYSKMFDMPVISHCEDLELSESGDMNEGYISTILGLRGIPSIAESVQVARDILISEYTDVPIHIAHVSTEASVRIVREAKSRGVKVTCETCPHYFTLTDESCLGYNTNAKVNPPLATERDRSAVIEGLKDGTIDIIATDHAPHHQDEKNIEFALAANGLIGFETAFGLAYTNLVLPGHITMRELVAKMSTNPARLFGLTVGGSIENGCPADITIVDKSKTYIVDINKFASKARNSPFDGYELTGKIEYTIVGGNVTVMDGVLMDSE